MNMRGRRHQHMDVKWNEMKTNSIEEGRVDRIARDKLQRDG